MGPQAPGPALHSSRLEVYLPDSRFSGSGPDRCTPRGVEARSKERLGASGSPFCPAPFSLPLPLLWPAATQGGGGGPGGAAFQDSRATPASLSQGCQCLPRLGHSQVLELRPSWGACPLLQPTCPTAAVSIPGFCQCSLLRAATYPLCPEPRRPAAFTLHPSSPTLCLRPSGHSIAPFTISPRAPRVLPSLCCLPTGSPPRLHQPCGLPIPLDPSSLVPTPEHTGK